MRCPSFPESASVLACPWVRPKGFPALPLPFPTVALPFYCPALPFPTLRLPFGYRAALATYLAIASGGPAFQGHKPLKTQSVLPDPA